MKKHLFTFLAVAFCATANADLLLVEDFDYTAGTTLSDCGWVTPYGGTSVTAVSNGLNFDNYAGCGIGNGAIISGNDGSYQPHKAFETVTSGDVYVAMMLQPYTCSKRTWFFSLRDAISSSTFNYNGRIWINEQNKIGLSYDKEGEKYADRVLDNETTYLVVLKYTIVAGAKNDQVALYLLDAFTAAEPAEPLLTTTNSSSSANADINPQNIVLRSSSDDDWILVDGIRVATTWTEAVAAGECPSTGVKQTYDDGLTFYTTPSALVVTLLHDDELFVYDTTGKCLHHDFVTAGTHRFALNKGFYVLKTTTQTRKIAVH